MLTAAAAAPPFYLAGETAALGVAAFIGTFLGVLLQSTGTKFAKAGLVSALTSTFPLWVIPIARVFLKEHTNRWCVLLTGLAVAGIALMMVPETYLEPLRQTLRHAIEYFGLTRP